MNSILEAFKDIKRVLPKHQALLFFLIFLLSGCYQSQQQEIAYHTNIAYAWLEGTQYEYSLPLDQLQFKHTNATESFEFQANQALLLKISFNEIAFAPQNKEFKIALTPSNFKQVDYYRGELLANSAAFVGSQKTYSPDRLSSQRFAFNVDIEDLFKSHYLLIESDTEAAVQVQLYDQNGFLNNEIRNNQLLTFLLTLVFAIGLYCIISYLFKHNRKHIFLAAFIFTSLWSLLWQTQMINYLPWLLWPFIGNNSVMFYELLAAVAAFAFVYQINNSLFLKRWLIHLFMLITVVQLALLFYVSLPGIEAKFISQATFHKWFSGLLIFMYALLILLSASSQSKKNQMPKQIMAGLAIMTIGLTVYKLNVFMPQIDLTWLNHTYETSIITSFLLMAIALSNQKSIELTDLKQPVRAQKQQNKSLFQNRLISQFQHEMQKLADNITLSQDEVTEKIHIKFHLLLTQAYPIKNSLILTNQDIEGICTTGINTPDIEFLKELAINHANNQKQDACMQKLIGMAGDKQNNVLFIPLKKASEQKVVFILTLKSDETLKAQTLHEIRLFCENAYEQLCQARNNLQTVLATKLDSLTHCYNRESIQTIIKHSLDQKKLTTIAYIELDHLQSISEQQGLTVTNQLLVEFAEILNQELAPIARIGRIGSDEFLVVFIGNDINICVEKLEAFYRRLSKTKASNQQHLACSVGIAESRMNETIRSLTKKAKTAMLHAKKQGGNQMVLFAVDMPAE